MLRASLGRKAIAVLAFASSAIPFAAHAADTITEFYNTNLAHYFITIDPNEAAAIDSGAAGPGWQRTGKTFAAYISQASAPAGSVAVCRFYGNQAKGGPNGHFYTAEAAECAAVKQDPGWTFERVEFYVQPATAGACPANTNPVYRNYNKRFAQNDSNHRYTTDQATYNAMIAQGWSGEGVVFCAASTTTTTPTDNSDCSIFYVNGKTIDYDTSTTSAGSTNNSTVTRAFGANTTFAGVSAMQVIDTSPGSTATQFIQDTATEWLSLGNQSVSGGTTTTLTNQPAVRNPKSWTVGQSRTYTFNSVGGPSGTGAVNGTETLSRRESVTVTGGTFDACVFHFDQTTTYATVGSTSHSVSDMWVAPGVGVVKTVVNDTTSIAGFSITSTATSTLKAVR